MSYDYDAANRLTQAETALDEETYSYDGLGNRLSSAAADDWEYNQNNQLIAYGSGTVGYTYDSNGNMRTKTQNQQITSYEYTIDNRLSHISRGGTAIADYYYDPFGRRLWKETGGSRTCFHYTDEGLAGEYNASGTAQLTYFYYPDSPWGTDPLVMEKNNQRYYYINDHLGTPQRIIAENGSVVWSALYSAFGEALVTKELIENNLRFPGQYFDSETGLHYNWHRYYDPKTGRYVSADPIGLKGGINRYVYVWGNPTNWIDPSGLETEGKCTDHAGKQCCCALIKEIELRIDDSTVWGHAFLHTPNMTKGFYANGRIRAHDYFTGKNIVSGKAKDDKKHVYNDERTRTYEVCPETLKLIEDSMHEHAEDNYQLGNYGARNCAGWACDRLGDAGIKPPSPPDTGGLKPDDIGK